MPVERLPPELWAHIALLSQRSDLPSLALVSTMHKAAVRPAIFQQLTIWMNQIDVEEGWVEPLSLKVLRRYQAALGWNVKKLELRTNGSTGIIYKPQPLLDALTVMPNIRHLSIQCRWPFMSPSGQSFLLSALNMHCRQLQTIAFDSVYSISDPEDEDDQVARSVLTGLREIRWWNSNAQHSMPFGSRTLLMFIRGSASTLTRLILSTPVDNLGAEELTTFSARCFMPVLETLVLGVWSTAVSITACEALVQLLYLHPTILNLSLGWDKRSDNYVQFPTGIPELSLKATPSSAPSPFKPRLFLPNLQRLDAHALTALALSSYRGASSATFLELRIGTGANAWEDIGGLISHFLHTRGLPQLKKFAYLEDLTMNKPVSNFVDDMDRLASACPMLEIWEGIVPFGPEISVTVLMNIFSKFTNVQEVNILSWWPVATATDTSRTDVARALASSCPKLEYFSTTLGGTSESRYVIKVERGPDGRIGITSRVRENEEEDVY